MAVDRGSVTESQGGVSSLRAGEDIGRGDADSFGVDVDGPSVARAGARNTLARRPPFLFMTLFYALKQKMAEKLNRNWLSGESQSTESEHLSGDVQAFLQTGSTAHKRACYESADAEAGSVQRLLDLPTPYQAIHPGDLEHSWVKCTVVRKDVTCSVMDGRYPSAACCGSAVLIMGHHRCKRFQAQ